MKCFLSIVFVLLFTISSFSQAEKFIIVDDTKIWVKTTGLEDRQEDQPVIVLESGLGTPMDHWDRIFPGISELAPVVAYDRPGVGESEPDNEMPTAKNVADKLVKLLNHLKVEPPYLLVGHSLGGYYVRAFAEHYPEMLAGLVIIDPADFTETQKNKRDYYDFLGWDDTRIDHMVSELEQNLARRRQGAPLSIREEGEILAEARKNDFSDLKHPLPNIPVHIITGGKFDLPEHLRSKEYDDEAIFRSKMKHRINRWTEVVNTVDKGMLLYSGDAGHFVHYEDPLLVISSIRIALEDYKILTEKGR